MKKIGIDARLYSQTGVGTYIRNLLDTLIPHISQTYEVILFTIPEDYERLKKKYPTIRVEQTTARWHSLKEQFLFLLQLYRHSLDLMHFTYFSHPIFYFKPFIITIHDLIPLTHATGKASTLPRVLYSLKYAISKLVFHNAIKRAHTIVTPSQTVKQEITIYFSLPKSRQERIVVTYEGLSEAFYNQEPTPHEAHGAVSTLPKKYFVYVGNFYPHKNISYILDIVTHSNKDLAVVLVGPKDYFADTILNDIHNRNIQNKVSMVHNLSQHDLKYVYSHAQALLHVSKSEGFGLTPLEAMASNTSVLASDIPIFHEILHDAFYPVPLNNIEDAVKVVEQSWLNKPTKRLSLTEIKKYYSFKTMAEKTQTIYESVINR